MDANFDLSDVFQKMPVLICVADPADGRILYKNMIARELSPDARFLDETPLVFEARPGAAAQPQTSDRPAVRRGDGDQAYLVYNRSIQGRFFRITRYPITWNGCPAVMFCGLDHTEIKESEQLMTASMYMDSMTGIYNRQFAMDILNRYAEELSRGGDYFTVCYLDVDNLKHINDTRGHPEGDKYIMEVVSVIKNAVRETDTFARTGGDEFLILFPKCPHEMVLSIMENVARKLEDISSAADKNVRYSLSYGILEVREAAGDFYAAVEDIMNAVDARMYEMKKEHRDSVTKNKAGTNWQNMI